MGATFEWDPAKDEANRRKHGVSFREALSAFMDPLSITVPDPDHPLRRRDSFLLGENRKGQLLVVSHTDWQGSHPDHQRSKG